MTFDLDLRGWRSQAAALWEVAQHDFSGRPEAFLADEASKLIQQIVAFTPPLGPGGKNAGARQAGEKAIEREVKSLFSEARPSLIDEVGSKHGIRNIDTFIEGKDMQPIRLQWANLDPTGDRMKDYHRKFRGYRGKIPLQKQSKGVWKSRVVVPEGTRQPFIDALKLKVGRWRASIAAALPVLGKPVPNWVSRHFGSVNDIAILGLSMLNHPVSPSIMFGTRAPGIGNPQYRYQERIQSALRSRMNAMRNRARLMLSGYSEDVSAGMRPRRRAQETSFDQREATE